MDLTHVDKKGVKMVEISGKKEVKRIARAKGKIRLKEETITKIKEGKVEKGSVESVFTAAQVAGTLAVKRTSDLIPMCHPLQITGVDIDFEFLDDGVEVSVDVKTVGKTGVEMEAITGVCVALLTIWDMVKAVEKDEMGQYPVTEITDIRVVEKIKGE